ncbi:hypothetical protein HDU93_006515 [Gonapodya sp. JEL0774]|nr:hypothetical protein HDU93_006515 [Gonapodya sp. JEL0774]
MSLLVHLVLIFPPYPIIVFFTPVADNFAKFESLVQCAKSVYPTEKAHEGAVYCEKHLPKPRATAVADSVATVHATTAPKKAAEGLAKTVVGTGDPGKGMTLDSVSLKHAVNAPKKSMENLGTAHKGASSNHESVNNLAGAGEGTGEQ